MGLLISVYRSADMPDCSNKGVSSKHKTLCVVNIKGPFEPTDPEQAVKLEEHVPGIVRLVPVEPHPTEEGVWVKKSQHHMAGGNFGYTSDSRFCEKVEELTGEKFYGAVAIHDRVE